MVNQQLPKHEEVPRELYPTLVRAMMRRQAGLSLSVSAIFLSMLFLLPLVNYYWPELASYRVGGFTLTWLFLAILFYPITWVLSWYFIKASDRIEHECSDWRKLAGASRVDAESGEKRIRSEGE